MIDTRIYDVMFSDGTVRQYLANSIAGICITKYIKMEIQ